MGLRPALTSSLQRALATLVTTCRDNPLAPRHGGRAYLALRPVLESPAGDLQSFSLTIDSLRVIVVRPVSDTLADTSVFFNPDSSSLHLALPLLLKSAEETLTVSLILSAGGVPIFSGSDTVPVSVGPPSSTTPVTVPLSYSGPGKGVTHLSIAPADSAIREGDSLRFRVSADSAGTTAPNSPRTSGK